MTTIYVIMGASGVGKDELGKRFSEELFYTKLVSTTTREMREGEQQGVDYNFVTPQEMESISLLEQVEYAGNTYGYSRSMIDAILHKGDTAYTIATLSGYEAIKKYAGSKHSVIGIYLLADEETLKYHMAKRGDSLESIKKRITVDLKRVQEEVNQLKSYDSSYEYLLFDIAELNANEVFTGIKELLQLKPKPNHTLKKYYLSGKISGLADYGRSNFTKAKQFLMKKHKVSSYNIFNPTELGLIKNWNWQDYMRFDIAKLMESDIIVMLPNYKHSKGALIELQLAKNLGMEIIYLEKNDLK